MLALVYTDITIHHVYKRLEVLFLLVLLILYRMLIAVAATESQIFDLKWDTPNSTCKPLRQI